MLRKTKSIKTKSISGKTRKITESDEIDVEVTFLYYYLVFFIYLFFFHNHFNFQDIP